MKRIKIINKDTELHGQIGVKYNYSLEDHVKRAIHVYDSNSSRANGHGFYFHYSNSVDHVVGYRIVDVLLHGLAAPHNSQPVFYLCSSLSRASYSGHRNGSPQSIVCAITNPVTSSFARLSNPSPEITWIETETLLDVYFEMRDQDFGPLPQYRFIVIVEYIFLF